MSETQAKWDAIYNNKEYSPSACFVLTQNQHLLPRQGIALDLACGQGGKGCIACCS